MDGSVLDDEFPAPPGLEAWRATIGGEELGVIRWRVGGPPRCEERERGLSQSEAEILSLVLAGRSNADIAARRGRSRHTVENQVATVFRKLRVRSRLELFALFAREREEHDR